MVSLDIKTAIVLQFYSSACTGLQTAGSTASMQCNILVKEAVVQKCYSDVLATLKKGRLLDLATLNGRLKDDTCSQL